MEPVTMNIPVLALRGLTVFPHMSLSLDVEREGSRITDLFLTGPTNIVAKGEVTDEDLCPAK